MVSFPYYSHIFGDSYGSGMGIVWEAYYKGVPLLGVPENTIDILYTSLPSRCMCLPRWIPTTFEHSLQIGEDGMKMADYIVSFG